MSKIIKDTVFTSTAFAMAALQEHEKTLADTFALDLSEILQTNIPAVDYTDPETGETTAYAQVGLNDENLWQIVAPASDIGTLALVTVYSDRTISQPEGAPLAIPSALYLINLPTADDMFSNTRLTAARDELMRRHALAAARKIAKLANTGQAPLVADRVAQLLTVTGTGSAAKLESAFNVMWRGIQGVILDQVDKLAEALKANGKHAKAREVKAVFSTSRLSKDILRACFQSKTAAEYYFPSLPQAQWENLLRRAIKSAPSFAPVMIVKDANGKATRNAAGEIVRAKVSKPQSPAIFQQWLATRDTAGFTAQTGSEAELSFDGLSI